MKTMYDLKWLTQALLDKLAKRHFAHDVQIGLIRRLQRIQKQIRRKRARKVA
tara:strand:+ start:955 stop:1110 length:156 start_codon:yes stop_codon:yes gene_type:complete